MTAGSDVRKMVDALLADEKRLRGSHSWQYERDREDVVRLNLPVEWRGELAGTVHVRAFPRLSMDMFRITLTVPKAVWRIDCAADDRHTNPRLPGRRGDGPPVGLVAGEHYHSWSDNRRFATAVSLPEDLKVCRVLPDPLRRFAPAFHWFCEQTGIRLARGDVPEIPRPDTLL